MGLGLNNSEIGIMQNLGGTKNLFLALFVLSFVFVSCVSADDVLTDQAISQAAFNAPEINKALNYYGGEKGEAAEYLVRGMLGRYSRTGIGLDSIEMLYREFPRTTKNWQFDSIQQSKGKRYEEMTQDKTLDLQTLTSEYITHNIDDSWRMKESRSWNKDLSVGEFCELLLPYRIGDEPVSEWRETYRNALDSISGKIGAAANSVEAAAAISKALGTICYNIAVKTPHRSALALLDSPVGYCREECDRNLYAMRAFGIPGAIDEFLVSPDNGISHQWNVVFDNVDRRFRMFDNDKYPPIRDSIHYDGRRRGKVYRRTFALDMERLKRFREIPDAPSELTDSHLKDVTAEYFGHNRADVRVDGKGKPVYLGIFTPEGYRPIDIAEKSWSGKAIFRDVEPDLIYFPIVREGAEYAACGNPFMLLKDGKVHEFIPDMTRMGKATLTRKMPLWLHSLARMKSVVGCKVQIGQNAEGPWLEVDSIDSMPEHSFYRIPIRKASMDTKVRYIRILPPPVQCSQISEVIASGDSLALNRLPMSVVTDSLRERKKKLVDGDILTWTNYKTVHPILVLKVDSDNDVDNIFIVPRNDDNYVVPGEEYELFYFDRDGWKSLGRKTSQGFSIEFAAPANAVLWLRNLTKGREEQVFIWKDGRQLFNTNLGSK